MAVKPKDILYGTDERVTLPLALGLGVQHCFAMSSTLVLAVILVDIAGGTSDMAHQLVRLSMIAAGIGTILQSLKRGPVGSEGQIKFLLLALLVFSPPPALASNCRRVLMITSG